MIANFLKGACEANKILLRCAEVNFLHHVFSAEFPACLEPKGRYPSQCMKHYYCIDGTIGVRSICQGASCTSQCKFNESTKSYDWFVQTGVEVSSQSFQPRVVGTEVPECGYYFNCEPSGEEKCSEESLSRVNIG